MSPRPFVITINTRLSFFFSHLCCPIVFLLASRTGPILRGQPLVRLRNAIIMRPIIVGVRGELLPFGSSEKFVATRDWIPFNYTYVPRHPAFVRYGLVTIFSYRRLDDYSKEHLKKCHRRCFDKFVRLRNKNTLL